MKFILSYAAQHTYTHTHTVRCIHVYILVSTSYKKLFLHSFHKIAQPTTQTNTQMRQTVYVSSPLLFSTLFHSFSTHLHTLNSTQSPHCIAHSARGRQRERERVWVCASRCGSNESRSTAAAAETEAEAAMAADTTTYNRRHCHKQKKLATTLTCDLGTSGLVARSWLFVFVDFGCFPPNT